MNILLPPELEKLVQDKVASGMYFSANEVICEGLRLLQEQDVLNQYRLEELDRKVKQGKAQADQGELIDGKEVMDELFSRHQAAKNAREKE